MPKHEKHPWNQEWSTLRPVTTEENVRKKRLSEIRAAVRRLKLRDGR